MVPLSELAHLVKDILFLPIAQLHVDLEALLGLPKLLLHLLTPLTVSVFESLGRGRELVTKVRRWTVLGIFLVVSVGPIREVLVSLPHLLLALQSEGELPLQLLVLLYQPHIQLLRLQQPLL